MRSVPILSAVFLAAALAPVSGTSASACAPCPVVSLRFDAGGRAEHVVVADFTHDGVPDLVVCWPSSSAGPGGARLLAGAHAAADTGFVLGPPLAIASGDFADAGTGDFDGDGIPDLVLVDRSARSVRLFRSLGAGVFATGPSIAVLDDPFTVNVTDVNRDGRLDLTVAPRGAYATQLLLGNGDGTFAFAQGPGERAHPVTAAYGDFDHDGILDAAVVNDVDSSLAIQRGLGSGGHWNGAWGPATSVHLIDTVTWVTVADLDGDGNDDLFACTYNGRGRILYGDGLGADTTHFSDWGQPFHGKAAFGLAHFAPDARRTFAIADPGETFCIVETPAGRGANPAPDERCTYGTFGHPVAAAVADLDGDGREDIVAVSPDAEAVTVQLQRCAPTASVTPGPGATFAIESVSPNPTRGELRVAFRLPRPGTATLELFDAAGRRVLRREARVHAAGAGALRIGAALAPGVYAVRLGFEGQWRTVLVSAIR